MRRAVLLAAVGALIVAALFVLVVWRQVRGDRIRHAVEAHLSATLGHRVVIEDLGLALVPAVSISATRVHVGERDAPAPAIDIRKVVIRPRLDRLVRGELLIQDVQLDGFEVSVLRDETGGWHLPPLGPAPAKQPAGGPAIERVRVAGGRIRIFDGASPGSMSERATIDAVETIMEPDGEGLRLSPISARIHGAAIAGEARAERATVRLQFEAEAISDDDLPTLLALLGSARPAFLTLDAPASLAATVAVERASARLTAEGTLRAPRVRFDAIQLQQFESPFVLRDGRLDFAPTTFTLYGGAHAGTVGVRFSPTRWSLDSRVTGMNTNAFFDALTGRDQGLEGSADAAAALSGRVDEPLDRTVSGRLRLVIRDGVIRDFPLAAAIGRALHLTEQSDGDTAFDRLSATFAIAAPTAVTDDLLLQASHVTVRARGRIRTDRSIDMRGIAVLSQARSAEAIKRVHELSGLRNQRGEIEVPLTMTGTLDAPNFDLDVGAALRKGVVDELRRRLRRIIRR